MQVNGWTGFDEKEDLPRLNDNLPMRKTTDGRRWSLRCQKSQETPRKTDEDYGVCWAMGSRGCQDLSSSAPCFRPLLVLSPSLS